jgi:glycosyltransferase involved in cell wall biosynthesis
VSRFSISHEVDDYYLVLSRLVSYKRLDVAIEACTKLRKKLLIIGSGPDRPRLEALAGPTVTFLGHIPDRKVEYIASRCRALLFPGEEDFGMAPLEIAAAGRPTIAYRAGGAVESIIEGETGVFFDAQTPESLSEAIERFERMTWFSGLLRRHAETFSSAVFHDRFRMFLRRIGAPLPADWVKTRSARVTQEKLGSVAS